MSVQIEMPVKPVVTLIEDKNLRSSQIRASDYPEYEIIVRQVRIEPEEFHKDLFAMWEVQNIAYPPDIQEPLEALKKKAKECLDTTLLAFDKNKPDELVAYAICMPSRTITEEDNYAYGYNDKMVIHDVATNVTTMKAKGLGHLFLQIAGCYALQQGFRSLVLGSTQPAETFWLGKGFRDVGGNETRKQFQDTTLRVMEQDITWNTKYEVYNWLKIQKDEYNKTVKFEDGLQLMIDATPTVMFKLAASGSKRKVDYYDGNTRPTKRRRTR